MSQVSDLVRVTLMKRIILIVILLTTACTENQQVATNELLLTTQKDEVKEAPKYDYVNEKFSFGLNLPDEFDVENLENGLLLQKWFDPPDPKIIDPKKKDMYVSYKLEIVFLPFDNFENYPNLAEYIAEKYPGYVIEFANDGYFVDEGLGADAIRHFFRMSDNKKVIYEAYMRVPSFHYGTHKELFDELALSMEIL